MRLVRNITIGFGALVVLIVVVLLAIPLFFRDTLNTRAKAEVNKAVNARVAWNGVGLSLIRDFPNVSLTLDGTRIIVAFTGDEEDAGPLHLVSRQPLIDAAKRSDVALAFEEDAGKGTVARRGFSGWQLTVTGRQAHSSGIFSQGTSYGAIYEAARILNAFREKLSTEQYLTFNPAVIVGGTDVSYDSTKISGTAAGKDNIIAPRVFTRGDLRFISQDQLLKAREAMRAIVADHLPGTDAAITFEDGNPAMPPTKGNLALLAVEDSVSRALGQGPVEALDPGKRGGGDISYISEYVDALDGLGVKGMRSHTPDERVDLRSIGPATERAALLIYRLTRGR